MSKTLPERPNLDWYRKAAKKSLRELRARDPKAQLADAQLAGAREHGFSSWRKLTAAILKATAAPAPTAVIDPDLVKQFSDALNRDRGDVTAIRMLLDEHPALANCHPWLPKWPHSAIEAAAHMCVWHRPKMLEIARLLLERGATCDLPTVARAGMLDEMERRLDADPSLLNKPDAQGRTAIYRAACLYGSLQESIPVVKELLARGATVDVFTAASWLMIERLTPMLAADPSVARAKDPEGLTALHWVTRTDSGDPRQIQAARLLLDAGADANAEATTQNGMRPLHCAAEWASSTELAGLLIDRGAIIDATSSQSDWTPLDYATDRNRATMRDYLRSRGAHTRQELGTSDDGTIDEFLKRVHAGDLAAITARLDASPSDVNRVGKHPQWGGRPQALHVAIETGNQAMFDLLLTRGAKPGGDNALYDHWSPLMLAIHWKRDAMRDELLKRVDHVSLIDALMMADDPAALRILQSGGIMLQRSMPNDATMLHFARTPAIARRLIELGVPIDAKDKYGKSALDLAASRGDHELADDLLARGAAADAITFARLGDLKQFKQLAPTPTDPELLKAAIEGGRMKIVRWIVSTGKDVNAPDSKGASPLHVAAWQGNLAIAKFLVKAGANVHQADAEHGTTPAVWARHNAKQFGRSACVAVADYLEKQMKKPWSVDQLPERRKTHKITQWKPIMDAAFNGDTTAIKKLLAAGVDPNIVSTTPAKYRPLHRAIERKKSFKRGPKDVAAVEVLLAGGADPHLRGGWSMVTALQMAATYEPLFVPVLVDRFRPLDVFHAAAVGDDARVRQLLKKDRSLATARDGNQWTPLHYAAASRMHETNPAKSAALVSIAKMLLDAGADAMAAWNFGDEWPLRPLYYAAGWSNHPAMVEVLLQAGADPCDNESVYHASDEGYAECLALIEKYVKPKKLAKESTMCLATQLHWGHSKGAAWLLAHGADPNVLHAKSGNSALHSAAMNGASEKVIALLLAHGGDPKAKNAKGETAIELAKAAGKKRVVEQLTAKRK